MQEPINGFLADGGGGGGGVIDYVLLPKGKLQHTQSQCQK